MIYLRKWTFLRSSRDIKNFFSDVTEIKSTHLPKVDIASIFPKILKRYSFGSF